MSAVPVGVDATITDSAAFKGDEMNFCSLIGHY